MVQVNLDGGQNKEYERFHIPDDVYEAVIKDISDPFISTGQYGEKEKICFTFLVSEGSKDYELPMFVTTTVSKGEGNYSSSKLFEILDKAEKVQDFKETWERIQLLDKEQQGIKFIEYLRDLFVDKKKCKVLTKTVNKDDEEKRYSIVKEVTRFL